MTDFDTQLLRYHRQILLPDVGVAGQKRLGQARVLIVGLGGLGSPVAMYLAAAGVGELILADGDHVELSNLHRQIIHTSSRIGQNKALSANHFLRDLNPDIRLTPETAHLTPSRLHDLVTTVQVVVEASDNFTTRFAVNRACRAAQIPLVSGAVTRLEGQLAVFSGQPGDPCYHCVYPELPENQTIETSCIEQGILPPVAGVIGSLQACEVIKLLLDMPETMRNRLLLFDARHMQWRTIELQRDPHCSVCC
jgi:adenylyltransferase/sulfurtransferase